MTSGIAAPAFGAVDGADGLLPNWALVAGAVPADAWVVVCVCPDWLLPPCEHPAAAPATRKDAASSAAIRIPSG
jgi:hypothetical protein